jgi:hypothetical protein
MNLNSNITELSEEAKFWEKWDERYHRDGDGLLNSPSNYFSAKLVQERREQHFPALNSTQQTTSDHHHYHHHHYYHYHHYQYVNEHLSPITEMIYLDSAGTIPPSKVLLSQCFEFLSENVLGNPRKFKFHCKNC